MLEYKFFSPNYWGDAIKIYHQAKLTFNLDHTICKVINEGILEHIQLTATFGIYHTSLLIDQRKRNIQRK